MSKASVIRVYDKVNERFIDEWSLLSDGTLIAITENKEKGDPVFIVDRFTERWVGDTPVYENDIVEMLVQNEFGSALKDQGVVRYDRDHMCFYITSERSMSEEQPLPTKIVKILGHDHAE